MEEAGRRTTRNAKRSPGGQWWLPGDRFAFRISYFLFELRRRLLPLRRPREVLREERDPHVVVRVQEEPRGALDLGASQPLHRLLVVEHGARVLAGLVARRELVQPVGV